MGLKQKVFEFLVGSSRLPVGYVRLDGKRNEENLYLQDLNKKLLPVLAMFLDITDRISNLIGIPMAVTNWIRWSPSHRTGLALDLAFRPSIPDYAPYKQEDPLLNLRKQPFKILQDKVVNDPTLIKILDDNHPMLAGQFTQFRGATPVLYIFIETHHLHIMILPDKYGRQFFDPKNIPTPTRYERKGRIRVFRFFMPSFTKGWKNGAFDYSHGRAHFLEKGPLEPKDFKHIRRRS